MVKAGLLTPLDSYATLYGWDSRLPMSMRQPQMFSADGSQFGAGRLFGVPLDASVIGVYYNKQKLAALGVGVPQTFGEFEHDLALAKAAGQTPIKFGALDGWPAIHDFQAIQNAYVPQQSLIDLIYSRRGAKASFDTPQNVQAATTFRRWARAGYFGDGFLGIGYDSAEAQFAKGDGVFTITGEWEQPVFKTMGDNVGFFLMPPSTAGGTVIATGGPELPFSIPSGSEHKALAAAYIDFLLSTQTAAQMVRERYGTPAIVEPWSATPQQGTLFEQVASAIASVNEHNGLVEFLDYSTPTFYNTITAKLQELGAGRITPQQFTAALENDYADFQKTRAGGG
jgi:raffinose/stachyose/melibiose transport system substrate-binding protein